MGGWSHRPLISSMPNITATTTITISARTRMVLICERSPWTGTHQSYGPGGTTAVPARWVISSPRRLAV